MKKTKTKKTRKIFIVLLILVVLVASLSFFVRSDLYKGFGYGGNEATLKAQEIYFEMMKIKKKNDTGKDCRENKECKSDDCSNGKCRGKAAYEGCYYSGECATNKCENNSCTDFERVACKEEQRCDDSANPCYCKRGSYCVSKKDGIPVCGPLKGEKPNDGFTSDEIKRKEFDKKIYEEGFKLEPMKMGGESIDKKLEPKMGGFGVKE